MHDPLLRRMHVKETYAKFRAVPAQSFYLCGSNWVSDISSARISGDIVVYRCDRELRTSYAPPIQLESLKSLRRSYFVYQVKIDIQECGFASLLSDDMRMPDFFE